MNRAPARTVTQRGLLVVLAVSALTVTGCSAGDGEGAGPAPDATTTAPAPDVSTPTTSQGPKASTGPADALDAAGLADLFARIQFAPGQYATTTDLLESVYPGLAVSDPACLAPFGLGWEQDVAGGDAATEFATSTDRSMTAVVVSATDARIGQDLFTASEEAVAGCSDGSVLFSLSGTPVTVHLERTEPQLTGVDQVLGWTATGDVDGASFTLVGITARVGGSVIALVGWDPTTSATYVPVATQMFVDGF